MGLGGMKYAWQRQTKDFGHTKADVYSSLVFDNRGIGSSSKPTFRYSTSEMAKDVVELVDHLGWTDNRSLHVIGISMGGMIAQELVSYPPTPLLGSDCFLPEPMLNGQCSGLSNGCAIMRYPAISQRPDLRPAPPHPRIPSHVPGATTDVHSQAMLIPDRICTLSLVSTAAGVFRTTVRPTISTLSFTPINLPI
jgi:pimeloyl-ACP methyl ester carboxylesterase